MVIVGLTGSIGMGKSTAGAMLRRLGVPVHDADAAVHRLLARGGAAVGEIARQFPNSVADGVVNRQALGALVFNDPPALKRLESVLHPLARRTEMRFLAACARRRERVVALNVPLLYETGGERRCDAVIVVSAPGPVQISRVLIRSGMTRDKLRGVLARQMDDAAKRRRADYVVPTGLGKRLTLRRLARIVAELRQCRGRRWRPGIAEAAARLEGGKG